MPGQTPRKGWIYFINPKKVVLTCNGRHTLPYSLPECEFIDCRVSGCSHQVNLSRVMRGTHPYIVWKHEESLNLATVIPLTSKEALRGRPDTLPIKPNAQNNLSKTSLAVIPQIATIDNACFKDKAGRWMNKHGILGKTDKQYLTERILYHLDIPKEAVKDWFLEGVSKEKLVQECLKRPEHERAELAERLLETL